MQRFFKFLPVVVFLGLSACAESVWAPDDAVTKSSYSPPSEPPSITLVTVINNNTDEGGHSAILINAHERVVFDPAGNWKHSRAPERNDFVYGMTPSVLHSYYSFHARTAWHVVTQTIVVSPEIAAQVYQSAKNNGPVSSAMCSNSVSAILRKIPGFESIQHSLFPKRTMKNFALLPGVTTNKIYEYD